MFSLEKSRFTVYEFIFSFYFPVKWNNSDKTFPFLAFQNTRDATQPFAQERLPFYQRAPRLKTRERDDDWDEFGDKEKGSKKETRERERKRNGGGKRHSYSLLSWTMRLPVEESELEISLRKTKEGRGSGAQAGEDRRRS